MNNLIEKNEVKRALFGDYRHKIKTFCIMTPENPMSKKVSKEENSNRVKEFKDTMKKIGVQFIPVQGFFDANGPSGNTEHSFILINISLDEIEGQANKYQQLSFFFGQNYWGINPNVHTDVDTGNNIADRHTSSVISY